jgi:type IV pilus assembly protein PilX
MKSVSTQSLIRMRNPSVPVRPAERGAALFVALMLLIILSLLAVSAAQVTSLQERMVAAYWADAQLFEGVEGRLNRLEAEVAANPDAVCANLPAGRDPPGELLGTGFDPAQATFSSVENIGFARGAGANRSIRAGQAQSGPLCLRFRVTVAALDSPAAATSRSIAQSTYLTP